MKKLLAIFVVIAFGCSLALAVDNTHISNPSSTIQKDEITKTSPIVVEKTAPNWVITNNTPADNAVLTNVIKDKPAPTHSTPANPDRTILDTGDDCSDPLTVDALPFYAEGYSCDFADDCDLDDYDSNDIFYEMVIADSAYITVSLSGSDYDTKLAVYQDECCAANYFLYNDDYDGTASQVSGIFAPATYYVMVDGYNTACGNYVMNITESEMPVVVGCPDGTLYGQEPTPVDGSWSAATSDAGADEDYRVYENFEFDSGNIGSIIFYGITLEYDSGWYLCTESSPEFEIKFYEDESGVPGTEVASYTVTTTMEETNYLYSSYYPLYQFTAELSPAVEITSGWVSVQGTGDPEECWFLWMSGENGDGYSYQEVSGELGIYYYDDAMCLVAAVEEGTGETCDDPLIVDEIPFYAEGYSCDFADDCDIYDADNSDVIYEMVVTEATGYIISLSGSDYDTKLAVYQDECCTGEDSYFLYNDDYDGTASQVSGAFPAGTYYVVVDGYGTNCGNYVMNITEYVPPSPLCEQAIYGADDDWNFVTSDTEVGPYVVYDNFECTDLSSVESMTFWGIDLQYDSGWYECEENPTEMQINFYPDNGNIYPDVDNPTCTYTVAPEVTFTDIWYADYYELVQYDVTLDEACPINEGWLSIQGTLNDGNVCLFLWGASPDGDLVSYQDQNGTMAALGTDLARNLYGAVGIDDEAEALPATIDMLSNYPNPFNAKTTISFSLETSGNVAIDIYDILGRRIDKLDLGYMTSGQVYSVNYDASNIATGVYFYSLNVNGQTKVTERFSLLK